MSEVEKVSLIDKMKGFFSKLNLFSERDDSQEESIEDAKLEAELNKLTGDRIETLQREQEGRAESITAEKTGKGGLNLSKVSIKEGSSIMPSEKNVGRTRVNSDNLEAKDQEKELGE